MAANYKPGAKPRFYYDIQQPSSDRQVHAEMQQHSFPLLQGLPDSPVIQSFSITTWYPPAPGEDRGTAQKEGAPERERSSPWLFSQLLRIWPSVPRTGLVGGREALTQPLLGLITEPGQAQTSACTTEVSALVPGMSQISIWPWVTSLLLGSASSSITGENKNRSHPQHRAPETPRKPLSKNAPEKAENYAPALLPRVHTLVSRTHLSCRSAEERCAAGSMACALSKLGWRQCAPLVAGLACSPVNKGASCHQAEPFGFVCCPRGS